MTDPISPLVTEDAEAIVAELLDDLRGRKFLSYLFSPEPETCGAYGYINTPFDKELQGEISRTWAGIIGQGLARHRQRTTDADQRVEGEALSEAVIPWTNFHGDLPDYDHPLCCVYESGIQYAVELLAKTLNVDDYEVCDGTEEFDGDLGGTMFNIVLAAMPKDADGDPIYPQELRAALSRTAGEREALEKLRELSEKAHPRVGASVKVLAELLRLGAERQQPRWSGWQDHDWEADAAFIVAAVNHVRDILSRQPAGDE
jgi:hypothetical protein